MRSFPGPACCVHPQNVDGHSKGAPMINPDRIAAHIVAVALIAATTSMPTKSVQAAVNEDEPPSVTLRFSATDLGTPQGVAGLYRRIRGAAATVCPPVRQRAAGREAAMGHMRQPCGSASGAQCAQRQPERLSLAADRWVEVATGAGADGSGGALTHGAHVVDLCHPSELCRLQRPARGNLHSAARQSTPWRQFDTE